MKTIDLNADLGEADTPDWRKAEQDILTYISSANIACGGHRGNHDSMTQMVMACRDANVMIGAHPAYPDSSNFGRRSFILGADISAKGLYVTLTAQITDLMAIAAQHNTELRYVKPHGALYNDAVIDREKADIIARVIYDIDPRLIFMGGPKSEMSVAAKAYGLRFIAEGFIDRRYTDDGHLQSRAIEGAVIDNQSGRMAQLKQLITAGTVTTISGNSLVIAAHSLCLHGDSAGAIDTARRARRVIEAAGFEIRAFA